MKIGSKSVKIFKMKNRKDFAAICGACVTEGTNKQEAYERMVKAIRRKAKK